MQYWILRDGTSEALPFSHATSNLYLLSDAEKMTIFEQVTTSEDAEGGADLMLDMLDGTAQEKIGYLNTPPLEKRVCFFDGDECTEKFFPEAFISSFNGNYLLNKPSPGGGLGEPAIVITRDGAHKYLIPFFWHASSAVWLSENALLAQDQNGINVFTFNVTGAYTKNEITSQIGDSFSQNSLSPDKQHLGSISYNPHYQIHVRNTTTFETIEVENIQHGSIDSGTLRIVGWNQASEKMLYVLDDEAKIFDLGTRRSSVIATLKTGEPAWAKSNRLYIFRDNLEIQ
jgi:hypothetical protein